MRMKGAERKREKEGPGEDNCSAYHLIAFCSSSPSSATVEH